MRRGNDSLLTFAPYFLNGKTTGVSTYDWAGITKNNNTLETLVDVVFLAELARGGVGLQVLPRKSQISIPHLNRENIPLYWAVCQVCLVYISDNIE